MHNRKEWLIVLVGVLICGALIYSAFHPSKPDRVAVNHQKNIAVLLRSSTDDYWNYVRKGADNAALEYDVTLQLHFPENDGDIAGQIRIAHTILASNPDAIIIAANSDKEFAEVLEEANRRRIPVIAVDSKLTSGVTTTYIGSDNEAYGQEAMKEMAKLLNYKGNLLVVDYTHAGINGEAREQGVYEELKNYNDINVVSTVVCTNDVDQCKQIVKKNIKEHEVDGILALMTTSSISSALALKELNASNDIKMVGFDSSIQLLELLQEGQMESLFVQNAFSLGYLSVQYAVQAADGQNLSSSYLRDMTIVNKDNMFWLKNQKLLYPVVH
ncbi:MAG: substrate-binding domain-containing protein [Candidatus Pristimantibacillus lignocellulolyticus]|uniref:Substrate-binding domain-containing protein n=1 Tax=Candidatus Pristimantibacillus lignocellulolyticus TaxID=2994561 RepID=A0A9J6ZK73_9BACL|nr:MAG: substrate-binding domain-containing protein [Candidatus Pristimantibacillus lignocellulolyticus]